MSHSKHETFTPQSQAIAATLHWKRKVVLLKKCRNDAAKNTAKTLELITANGYTKSKEDPDVRCQQKTIGALLVHLQAFELGRSVSSGRP
jgi:hypothetical protein